MLPLNYKASSRREDFMNELEKLQSIKESALSQGFYFQALFQEACSKGLFDQAQIEKIQLELIELLGKEVERYTNGESSSVPVEKAQELLQSITYSMGFYLKSIPEMEEKLELLKTKKIAELFYKGMEAVAELKNKAAQLLEQLQKNHLEIENIAYQDTILNGISPFFHDYNIEYGAHDIPGGSVDYPLLTTDTQLLGVECVYDYLSRLSLENDFLTRFPTAAINRLLKGFHKEAGHMLINILELVLTNVLGCELLGTELTELNISSSECTWLKKYFQGLTLTEIQEKLLKALERAGAELKLERTLFSYAGAAIEPLAVRINANLITDTLSELFISLQYEEEETESFEDGISMEDEKLRELIEELSGRRSVSEKLALIRERIKSLRDFTELLDECFYGDEYREIFQMLNDTEKEIILRQIREEAGPEDIRDYNPEMEWQKIFLKLYQD